MADEAREYFAHPSQQIHGLAPDALTDGAFLYYANGPICGVFHQMPWPDVWMGHYGAKPEGWGRLVEPARAILRAFSQDVGASRVLGWTPAENRAACAFARRLGFVEDGRMSVEGGEIIMQGWAPWL